MPYSNTYTSPADAVSDQLQNILAQKRIDARQKMLDDLNAQNTQSEMAYRASQMQSLGDLHNATAAERNAKAQEIADKKAQDQQVLKGFDDFMSSDDFKALPKITQQQMHIARLAGDTSKLNQVLTGLTQQNKDEEIPGTMWDYDKKKFVPMLNPDNTPILVPRGKNGIFPPRPQVPPQGPANIPMDVTDKNGHRGVFMISPRAQGIVPLPDGYTYNGKAGTYRGPNAAAFGKLTGRTQTVYLNTYQAAHTKNAPPEAQTMWTLAGQGLINEYPADPDVKEAILEAWKDPANRVNPTISQLTGPDEKPITDPNKLQQAKMLWSVLVAPPAQDDQENQ